MGETDVTIRDEMAKAGYSQEEEYFYRLNRELIERRRQELDAKRAREVPGANVRLLHWMKCPKCGGQMKEIELAAIRLDQCANCHGVYFDQGELETLLASAKPHRFLKLLSKLFKLEEEPRLF